MDRTRFGPERIAVFPVVILLLGSLPLATTVPWLGWLVLVPLVALVWVLRARVVADAEGLEVCNGLQRRRYAWTQVEGFDVPRRGPVRLLLAGAHTIPLTPLPRRQLPALLEIGGPTA